MSKCILDHMQWYTDPAAKEKDEPGLTHTYMSSLATVLAGIDSDIDPIRLMGAGGFAFRTFINEIFCPSAFSIFKFTSILPEVVEQSGHTCKYISRLWEQDAIEKERRNEAHQAIVQSIDGGRAAISWDVWDTEWGVIIGYDDDDRLFHTLTWQGNRSTMLYESLGQNGVDILSVAIPGDKNQRSQKEIIRKSLETAVRHWDQKEWTDRPAYQNGHEGMRLWGTLFERWKLLTDAGKADRINDALPHLAFYTANVNTAAKCYARDYLAAIADGDSHLMNASTLYGEAAKKLLPVWHFFRGGKQPSSDNLSEFIERVRAATEAEDKAIKKMKEWVGNNSMR